MAGSFKVRSALALAEKALKRDPTDPQLRANVDRLRATYRASALEDYIKRTVDALPPLSEDQRCKLALLLRGGDAA